MSRALPYTDGPAWSRHYRRKKNVYIQLEGQGLHKTVTKFLSEPMLMHPGLTLPSKMTAFGKLIRFKNASGNVFYGEAKALEAVTEDTLIGAMVPVYEGGEPWDSTFRLTKQQETIAMVQYRPLEGCKDHAYDLIPGPGSAIKSSYFPVYRLELQEARS